VTSTLFFPDWRERVVYAGPGPRPQLLHEDGTFKVVLVGLEPGGLIPPHPGEAGVYHFLEGAGRMQVDEEACDVAAGSTVIVPAGASRGMAATTRLAFIAVRAA
jgi:quercetin dioxygenase-like cupin family protein